ERKTGVNGTYQTFVTLPGGEDIYTDTSCWAGTTYFYRIKAHNAGGDSGYCIEQSATTQQIPAGAVAVVSNLVATVNSPTSITVSFTDTNTGLSSHSYLLERSDDGISYHVVASLGTGTSFHDVGLTPGTTYSYRVRGASWVAPTSDYSPPVSATTSLRLQGAPIEPSGIQATV